LPTGVFDIFKVLVINCVFLWNEFLILLFGSFNVRKASLELPSKASGNLWE
jgi:hypothetical protein